MPSCSAASAPSTTTGVRRPPSSRNRPDAQRVFVVVSVVVSAAATEMPPVIDDGDEVGAPHGGVDVREPGRAEHRSDPRRPSPGPSRAASPSSPNAVWPGAARSIPVPSESISASTSARLDAEMPTTATIAAIPMAMPERGRGRAQPPWCAARACATSRARRRGRRPAARHRERGRSCRHQRASRRRRSTIRPSRIATWRGAIAATSRSWVISTIVRPAAMQLGEAGR